MICIVYLSCVFLSLIVLLTAFVIIYVITNILFVIFITKVPPVQTEYKYFTKIFSQIIINSDTVIYDLGCGGGNFLIEAAKFKPKKCIGYELSLLPFLQALIKSIIFGRGLVKIYFRDFFKVNIGEADLIYIYLVPSLLGRVAQKLQREMKTGATAIVKGQALPEMNFVDKIILDEKRNYFAYIYKF